MNADQLLQHFERISEAPDAIPRLRRFILDLAVRGKLVEQDPSDEPASELLKRIAAEKARLVKDGRIKKAEAVANLTASFDVFSVPTGWAVSNLQSICQSVTDGDHLPPPKAETGIPFLVIGNVRSQKIEFEGSRFVPNSYYDALDSIRRPRSGDLLYTLVGSYGIPVLVRDDQPFCVQRHIGILRPSALINVGFLARAMESRFAYEQATACATGIAQKTVSLSGLRKLMLPLPPLAEQHRIVVKVDELMSLCDQLDAAKAGREKCRDSLVAASLQRLNQPAEEEETFREHARFTFNNLPRITTRAAHIKQLRQTILNLAVRGALGTSQSDDPSALEDIKLIKDRKMGAALRKPKPVAPIEKNEQWCSLPCGWEWTRWDQITDWITYGFTRPMPHEAVGVPIVTGKNVNHGRIIYETADRTPQAAYNTLSDKDKPQTGDILITKDGSIGRTAVVEGGKIFCINQSVAVLWLRSCHLNRRFLQMVLDCPATQLALLERTAGVAIKHISINDLGKMAFPLPPLPEQHRIVAKVNELTAICDQLEAQITEKEQDSRRFLESILADALAPGMDLSAEVQVA